MDLFHSLELAFDAAGGLATISLSSTNFPFLIDRPFEWGRRNITTGGDLFLFFLFELPCFPFVVLVELIEGSCLGYFIVSPLPPMVAPPFACQFPFTNFGKGYFGFFLPFFESSTSIRGRKSSAILRAH